MDCGISAGVCAQAKPERASVEQAANAASGARIFAMAVPPLYEIVIVVSLGAAFL